MARPIGDFERGKEKVLCVLRSCMPYLGSNKDLGKCLGVSERQIASYISSLREDGKIFVQKSNLSWIDSGVRKFRTTRKIEVIECNTAR